MAKSYMKMSILLFLLDFPRCAPYNFPYLGLGEFHLLSLTMLRGDDDIIFRGSWTKLSFRRSASCRGIFELLTRWAWSQNFLFLPSMSKGVGVLSVIKRERHGGWSVWYERKLFADCNWSNIMLEKKIQVATLTWDALDLCRTKRFMSYYSNT